MVPVQLRCKKIVWCALEHDHEGFCSEAVDPKPCSRTDIHHPSLCDGAPAAVNAEFDDGVRHYPPAKDRIGDAAARKAVPLMTGVLDYFPDALLAVAALSKVGNDQHNPGQPLHWARSKSGDEADALMRHLIDRGTIDTDGVRHSAKVAWRALALLQKELEAAGVCEISRGSKPAAHAGCCDCDQCMKNRSKVG